MKSFTSRPGYPRLTDCDIVTTQAEAAEFTGAPVSPRLRYKYELVIDKEYFDKTFRNTGTRKGYSEYGTAKPIEIKYFRRLATLTVTPPGGGQAPPGGALPPTGGTGTLPPVSGTGGTSSAPPQQEEDASPARQSKWRMSPSFSAQLFGRTVDLVLAGVQTWALLNLELENRKKSKADRELIEKRINDRLESQSDKVVDWWTNYEPAVYVTITTQTLYTQISWVSVGTTPMSATRYHNAWLAGVQVDTSLGENAKYVHVLGSYTKDGVHDLLLVTETSSVLLPVDEEVLRGRLEARIEEMDAQLAAMSEIDRLSLRLERDRLLRRLQLLSP